VIGAVRHWDEVWSDFNEYPWPFHGLRVVVSAPQLTGLQGADSEQKASKNYDQPIMNANSNDVEFIPLPIFLASIITLVAGVGCLSCGTLCCRYRSKGGRIWCGLSVLLVVWAVAGPLTHMDAWSIWARI
jgi:hypothetical protein